MQGRWRLDAVLPQHRDGRTNEEVLDTGPDHMESDPV